MTKQTFAQATGLIPTGENRELFETAWTLYLSKAERPLTEGDKALAYWFWLTARIETLKLSVQVVRELKHSIPLELFSHGTDVQG